MGPGNRTVRIRSDKATRPAGADQGGCLAKNAGDCMKDLYYWFKTVDQFAITIAVSLELFCFVSEEVDDCVG